MHVRKFGATDKSNFMHGSQIMWILDCFSFTPNASFASSNMQIGGSRPEIQSAIKIHNSIRTF